MAEKPADKSSESPKNELDLNSLSGLNFGPNWADANAKQSRPKNYDSPRGGRHSKGGGGGNRDRRSGGRPQHDNRKASGGQQGGFGSGSRDGGGRGAPRGRRDDRGEGNRRSAPRPFQPTVKVDLYPQDEAFEALIKRLRSSARTYQLFDIAHLLLEKPDRYVVVVAPKVKGTTEDPAQLFYSVPGHLPFETEEAAISHVIKNHMDLFFDIEEIEIDPPKGNFVMVNKCGITGELLGPPNYHRYQEFLQTHYNARITGMSFERFQSRIEGVKEQEQIDAWMESMKKGARYTVKDRKEGEPESFETLESARFFLLNNRKELIVGSGESVRFAGRDIERLPQGDIRRSVESYVEQQIHFPLDSANNIRGRLRRHKFAVYKKGSKGISYVCAVKRRFRDSKTVFTDSITSLIDFIEKHPEISASKLPQEYIGIDTEKQKPEELKMTEAEVAAAAEAKAKAAAEASEATEPASESTEASPETSEEAPKVAEDASASTEATPKAEINEEDAKKLHQLMLDLRWLITEGYVTEYGDGKLFAAPPMPEAKPKEAKPKAEAPEVTEKVEAVVESIKEKIDPVVEAVAEKVDELAAVGSEAVEELVEKIAEVASEPAVAEDTVEPTDESTDETSEPKKAE